MGYCLLKWKICHVRILQGTGFVAGVSLRKLVLKLFFWGVLYRQGDPCFNLQGQNLLEESFFYF